MLDPLWQRYGDLVWRLVRFGVVGLIVTGSYAVVTYCFITYIGLPPLGAHLLGCTTAIAVSYFGQKYFTFRSGGQHRHEMPKFVVACIIAVVASSASIRITTDMGMDYRIGILIAAVVIPLSNFIIMNIWVFAHARRDTID